MPNKGAGRDSNVESDIMKSKLRFQAFQRWFQIENRSIIKEIGPILVTLDSSGGPQTIGGAFIRGCAFNRHITVLCIGFHRLLSKILEMCIFPCFFPTDQPLKNI